MPGLTINCYDERGDEEVRESFRFDGGVVDFANWLASDGPVTDTWHITGEGTYNETVQALDSKTGHLRATQVERTCEVDIALRWGIGYDTAVRSFVNIIATPKGGTHVAGFEQAVLKPCAPPSTRTRASSRSVQRTAPRKGRTCRPV